MKRDHPGPHRPPRWLVASRPISPRQLVAVAVSVTTTVSGLSILAGQYWGIWGSIDVLAAYALLLAWCHYTTGLLDNPAEMRYRLSVVTAIASPVYLLILVAVALLLAIVMTTVVVVVAAIVAILSAI